MRVNKTVKNLQIIWKQLDEASGSLYNALGSLEDMVNLSDTVKRQIEMIDISRIDLLKSEIEDLITNKK